MGREIGYCGDCGVRVEGVGAQGGMLQDRRYCPECLPEQGPFDPRPLPEVRPAAPRPAARTGESTKRTRRRKPSVLIGVAALLAVALAAGAWATSGGELNRSKAATLKCDASAPVRVEAKPTRPPPPSAIQKPDKPDGLDYKEPDGLKGQKEDEARALYAEFEETALGLADEGRFEGALRKIDAFPAPLRPSRAWKDLEALRRSIEIRRR